MAVLRGFGSGSRVAGRLAALSCARPPSAQRWRARAASSRRRATSGRSSSRPLRARPPPSTPSSPPLRRSGARRRAASAGSAGRRRPLWRWPRSARRCAPRPLAIPRARGHGGGVGRAQAGEQCDLAALTGGGVPEVERPAAPTRWVRARARRRAPTAPALARHPHPWIGLPLTRALCVASRPRPVVAAPTTPRPSRRWVVGGAAAVE